MDFVSSLGALVLDHRFRRLTEALLKAADDVYERRRLDFRARWASTYKLLATHDSLPVTEVAVRLRLTHPAVIAIAGDMERAGLVAGFADPTDGRRRLLSLTAKGHALHGELRTVWRELAIVQAARFQKAGCDILQVLSDVEEGLAESSIADEVIRRVERSAARRHAYSRGRLAIAVILTLVGVGLGACSSPGRGGAGPVVAAGAPVDVMSETIVAAVSDSLVGGYIYEPVARATFDSLRTLLRRGDLSFLADTTTFMSRLNAALLHLTNDRHLRVRHGSASPTNGPVRVRRPAASPSSATSDSGLRRVRGGGQRVFAEARVLNGNIGYLDMRGFPEEPGAVVVLDSLMTMLRGVDGLIIDLGRNGGGGPTIVRRLSRYLFDRPVHLVSTFARGMSAPSERWTDETVPGTVLSRIPVMLLTSHRTFSAAESFAFGLKVNGRVTIVGERTGGGGHFGRIVSLPGGFSMFLPVGRTYDPRTNAGWEATGIAPDVEVDYDRALSVALERLKASVSR